MNENEIVYIGTDDPSMDLFESQYKTPNGMAYNSWLVKGKDKMAIMDTCDARTAEHWLANLDKALDGATPDYLVISHMEPDHSSGIKAVLEKFPDIKIVASPIALRMLPHYVEGDFTDNAVAVKEGETIDLGGKTLQFVMAPMVHWPEVMMTYIPEDKVLFSADAFGKFGTRDADEDWLPEAARYYFNIVGKFGPQVQNVLKKAAKLDIDTIASLHGPVLDEDLDIYLKLYDTWSKYEPEINGVVIACTSVYGHTLYAAELLKGMLEEKGVKVILRDLSHHDVHEVMADCFRYSCSVFCATSYNGGVFPIMDDLLRTLKNKAWQNRTVGLVENGSWAPSAANTMKKELAEFKNITIIEPAVTIWGAVKEADLAKLEALAGRLAETCSK